MQKLKTLVLVLIILSLPAVVFGAPTYRFDRSIYPEGNNTYDLGSSTLNWRNFWGTNATTTNATSTNLFSSLGSFTNLFSTNATSTNLTTSNLFAETSAGLALNASNGTQVGLFGAGGGSNATFYGGVNIGTTTTSGTATVAFSPTMSGSSAVSNFLNITGTMPSPTSAQARALNISVTSNGSSSNSQYLANILLGAGYTGSSTTAGINLSNLAQGTGTAFWTNGSYNVGIYSSGSGTTAGHNVGFAGNASASSVLNVGVYGRSTASTNSPVLNIGNVALATGATYNIGAFFGLFSATPTITQSAVVMADNGSTGSDIFVARVNGTKTTTIDGTGNLGVGTTPTVRLDVLGNTNLTNTNAWRSTALTQGTINVGDLLSTHTATDQTVTGTLASNVFEQIVNYASAPGSSATHNTVRAEATIPSTNTLSSTNVSLNAGVFSASALKTTGDVGIIRGINVNARSNSGGTTTNIIGNTTISTFGGASGTVSGQITGVNGQALISSAATSATVATMNGLLAFVSNSSASATVTNAYGVQVSNLTNAGTITNTYGVYVGDVTTGTQTNTAYSFYASDASAKNYFAGLTGLGRDNAGITVTEANSNFGVFDSSSPAYYLYVGTTQYGAWRASSAETWIGNVQNTPLWFYTNNTERWRITNAGHFIAGADNSYDIGASGATRPRTGYFGTSLISPLVTTPSLTTSSGAMTITPAAGSNLNVSLSTTGDFAVNTSQLYVDTSAGNVGIGTTAPASKFHIYEASATSTAYISSGGAGLGGRIIMEDEGGGACTEITTSAGTIKSKVVTCP